jgi:hypothetical protein
MGLAMLRFVFPIGFFLVGYDWIVLDGKYMSTVGRIAHLVLLHFA